MRVLVTGAAGFVGSHLLKHLASLNIAALGPPLDVLDRAQLTDYVHQHNITTIIHLAGVTTVETGNADPAQTFTTNIQGTINVLECARLVPLERVIVASTVHVYGPQPPPYFETMPLLPTRPYETSKACADMIAQSYATTFDLPVLIPRFVNTYGPGDNHTQRLIPKTIQSFIKGQPPTLWGGSAQRDYLFIDDALSAYAKLLAIDVAKVGDNRAINIGTDRLTSVKDIMQIIADQFGKSLKVTPTTGRSAEIPSQAVSIAKAEKVLDWKPQIDITEGIKRTVQAKRETAPANAPVAVAPPR